MNIIKKTLLLNLDILIFIISLISKSIYLSPNLTVYNDSNNIFLIGSLGSVLILCGLFCFFNLKNRIRALFLVNFIISSVFFCDLLYTRYSFDVISLNQIKQIRLVGEVSDSVVALIRPIDMILFFDLVFILLIFLVLRLRHFSISYDYSIKLKFRALLFSGFIMLGLMLSYKSVWALNELQPGILNSFYDKKYIASKVGDINYHYFDAMKVVKKKLESKVSVGEEEKQEILDFLQNKNKIENPKYNGIAKDKNLIIVQLEAFQAFCLDRSINGQEITPNLNKLQRECLVFDNFYYQTAAGSTSDAELLSNTSMLPASDGCAYYLYSNNKYDSLISRLKDEGYYTAVMHANRPGFWNRSNMYKTLGFDIFEDENDFVIDDVMGLGLTDKSFFMQAVEKMRGYRKPFYTFLISLTSHFPYTDPYGRLDTELDAAPFEGELIGDFIKSAHYTDAAIGEFIEELKKEGLWENSVVVFYGDHMAIPSSEKEQLAKFIYGKESITPYEWAKEQRVCMMIHLPDKKLKGHKDIVGGQLDIFPTLANLFGIDAPYALGRDLLNSKRGFVTLKNNMWVSDEAIYLSNPDEIVDRSTGERLIKEDFIYEVEFSKKLLDYCDKIYNGDLLKRLLQ